VEGARRPIQKQVLLRMIIVDWFWEVPTHIVSQLFPFLNANWKEALGCKKMLPHHDTLSRSMNIPDFYNRDTNEALTLKIQWLQSELGFSDSFFSRLLGIREELFQEWKYDHNVLATYQVTYLKKFWLVITHILSFLNYQHDLVQKMLEYEDRNGAEPSTSPFAPPWTGMALKAYLERNGIEGIERVNDWVQSIRFASSF
jgi:hypothetical protein